MANHPVFSRRPDWLFRQHESTFDFVVQLEHGRCLRFGISLTGEFANQNSPKIGLPMPHNDPSCPVGTFHETACPRGIR